MVSISDVEIVGAMLRKDQEGVFYECGSCGARSTAPWDVLALFCRICGMSALELDEMQRRALEAHPEQPLAKVA